MTVAEALEQILSELKYQTKLLESQVELLDSRAHDTQKAKASMVRQVKRAAEALKGTPFANVLNSVIGEIDGQ